LCALPSLDNSSAYPSCERSETFPVRAGKAPGERRSVSRHKSIDVLSSYVRDADEFTDHAGAGLL